MPMASVLFLPCTTAASGGAIPFSSSRRPLFPKPPHSIIRPFSVSCATTRRHEKPCENDEPNSKVDRRNVLLGLGGAYGAASLITAPVATGSPVQAPELDKCGFSTYTTREQEQEQINCCPPAGERIIDYKLPPVSQIKIRPSAHLVSREYIYKYNLATDRMKRLPKDDPRNFMQQANVHCAYCNGGYNQPGQGDLDLQVHNSWLFFPFHRWYLYFYERILGKLIDDPTFALPFWNWDNPLGMTIPDMFMDKNSALYDSKRDPKAAPPAVANLGGKTTEGTDPRQVIVNNLSIMHTEMVRGEIDAYNFMGKPYTQGMKESDAGPGRNESGSHTGIHIWVGDPGQPSSEDLGNFYSAGRDPLFYCHHANVDRMWTIWQYFLPSKKLPDKRITHPDFLNASFVFYDENAQLVRVTVKDCLDNLRMGYDFERIDLPWLDYRPPRQASRTKIARAKSTVPNASTLFPLKLESVVRFQVDKTKKGKAEELLVLENVTVDTTKFVKFDVFLNDEDDDPSQLAKASYIGTYAQVPHKTPNKTVTTTITMKLTDAYDDMDVADDDTIVVTLVPRHQGPGVTIGGIKIVEDQTTSKTG